METKAEFKKLQGENEKIRERLDKIIGINHPLYSPLWCEVNKLISNEIKQEQCCNQ